MYICTGRKKHIILSHSLFRAQLHLLLLTVGYQSFALVILGHLMLFWRIKSSFSLYSLMQHLAKYQPYYTVWKNIPSVENRRTTLSS